MVGAVRPTLGPLPRHTVMQRSFRDKPPELLDDGATIARRIIQLPERDEDMGAMFVRQVLWHVHEKVGDGTATTSVLFQSVYDQGVRYVVAGGNAMRLRHFLEQGTRLVLKLLSGMSVQIDGKEMLAQVAESICHDPPLAKMLGEIFDVVGEYGQFDTRSGRSRHLEREYVEGMYWKGRAHSRQMIVGRPKSRAELKDASILITDLLVEDPREFVPVLEMAKRADIRSLLITTVTVSEDAISVLLLASQNRDEFDVVAAKTPGATIMEQAGALQDLAVLTGGRPVLRRAGGMMSRVRLEDLGRARRAWADRFHFGIVGGGGDPRALRQHIGNVRTAFSRAKDRDARGKLRERIGKLMGGSAVLRVGGESEMEIRARKAVAERTADALRGAMMEGVLPGGGMALLACRPALREALGQSTDLDEAAAYRILIRTMEEPIRTILTNAGYDAGEVMGEIKHAGPGSGFNARTGQIVNMADAGIYDATAVTRQAVFSAVSGAGLALTTDVLVHRKKPVESTEP